MNLSTVVRYHKFRAVQFCVHICGVLSCFVMVVSFCDVSHDVSVLQEACAKSMKMMARKIIFWVGLIFLVP